MYQKIGHVELRDSEKEDESKRGDDLLRSRLMRALGATCACSG